MKVVIAESQEMEEVLKNNLNNQTKIIPMSDIISLDASSKVILPLVAEKGVDSSFVLAGRGLYLRGIKPLLWIIKGKANEAQLKEAENSLANIWGQMDKTLDDTKLFYDVIYSEGVDDESMLSILESIDSLIN